MNFFFQYLRFKEVFSVLSSSWLSKVVKQEDSRGDASQKEMFEGNFIKKINRGTYDRRMGTPAISIDD